MATPDVNDWLNEISEKLPKTEKPWTDSHHIKSKIQDDEPPPKTISELSDLNNTPWLYVFFDYLRDVHPEYTESTSADTRFIEFINSALDPEKNAKKWEKLSHDPVVDKVYQEFSSKAQVLMIDAKSEPE